MATPLQLRDAVARLTGQARRDLAALWRQVDSAARAQEALHDILPALVAQYGAAAGALAAHWYDDLRAKQGIVGRFEAIPADIPDSGEHALVGWALNQATDYGSFQSLIDGGVQRRIANFSRSTVTRSSVADPRADGWQRVGSGECAFCAMLIGRGAVYSEASADFASHDHCNCGAAPAFGGQPRPVKPYTPSARSITDADRARVNAYLRGEPASTKTKGVDSVHDIDASRTVEQLRGTLADLERSAQKFSTPGTRARIEELRRKIAERG